MTRYEQKDMTGRLYKNIEKVSLRQPDYAGPVTVNGVVLRCAIWHNPPNERTKVATYSVRFSVPKQEEELHHEP